MIKNTAHAGFCLLFHADVITLFNPTSTLIRFLKCAVNRNARNAQK